MTRERAYTLWFTGSVVSLLLSCFSFLLWLVFRVRLVNRLNRTAPGPTATTKDGTGEKTEDRFERWDIWEWIPDYAIPVAAGEADAPFGWGVYQFNCPACNQEYTFVAAIGSRGFECDTCGYDDPYFLFIKAD